MSCTAHSVASNDKRRRQATDGWRHRDGEQAHNGLQASAVTRLCLLLGRHVYQSSTFVRLENSGRHQFPYHTDAYTWSAILPHRWIWAKKFQNLVLWGFQLTDSVERCNFYIVRCNYQYMYHMSGFCGYKLVWYIFGKLITATVPLFRN